MKNLTLSLEEELLKKARKIAIDKHTTLTEMIRGFVSDLVEREDPKRKRTLRRLKESFTKYSRDMGERNWAREDLYER